MDVFSKINYEADILLKTFRFFGFQKGMLFASRLPIMLISGNNRAGYEAMGLTRFNNIQGKEIRFKHTDTRFVDEIIVNRCYDGMPSFSIEDAATIVDAGANIGVFTILAALQARAGRVISVEPEKTNFSFLEDNVKVNNLSNVKLVNAALSNRIGIVQLLIKAVPSGHTILNIGETEKGVQNCSALTMSQLFLECNIDQADFLKMDIEGAEFLAFQDPNWLAKVVRLVVEIHPAAGDPEKLIRTVKDSGFNCQVKEAYNEGLLYLFAKRN